MGLASSIGGWVVVREPAGQLANFHWLGRMAVAVGLLSIWLAGRVRVNEAVAPNTTEAGANAPAKSSTSPFNSATPVAVEPNN